jgi:hypothetical protein
LIRQKQRLVIIKCNFRLQFWYGWRKFWLYATE